MRVRGLLVLGLLVALFPSAAGAAQERDELIRPGVGIGKVRLGMTDAQVRRLLGRPFASRSRREGFGRIRVELQFEDGYTFVTLSGRPRALRVVGVSTVKRSERTRQGAGVGISERRLARIYGGRLRCERLTRTVFQGQTFIRGPRTCRLAGPRGTTTVFISTVRPWWDGGRVTPANYPDASDVIEVGVLAAT